MPRGRVKYYNMEKGFGFIREDGREDDLFFHISAVEPSLTPLIAQNLRICFDVGKGRDGRPCAENVRPADK
jgi:cold shock protein